MPLTSKGSNTVSNSLTNSFTGSNFTFSKAIIQDTSGGTVNTAAKLQTTVSITDKATAPPAWAVCLKKEYLWLFIYQLAICHLLLWYHCSLQIKSWELLIFPWFVDHCGITDKLTISCYHSVRLLSGRGSSQLSDVHWLDRKVNFFWKSKLISGPWGDLPGQIHLPLFIMIKLLSSFPCVFFCI